MIFLIILFELEFSPCKTGQPLQGMELQEKKEEKDEKHIGKLVREDQKQNMSRNSRRKTI